MRTIAIGNQKGGAEPPRDIETITGEILEAKRVGGQAILTIGQCLAEAKAVLPHGEWLPWLSEKVEFSESTAQRFMRLARDWSNPSALTDLGASKALALLALPPEEREQFMAEPHEVDGQGKTVVDMTSRELDKAIRDRKEALAAAEAAEAKAKAAEESRVKMEADVQLMRELLDAANTDKQTAQAAVSDLERQIKELKAAPVDVAVMAVDQAALDKARTEAVAGMQEKLDKAKAAKDKADERRKAAEEALSAANAKLEAAEQAEKKTAIVSDKDMALMEILFEQGKGVANQMQGILIKLRRREDQTAASAVKRAMLALSDAIRGAAE